MKRDSFCQLLDGAVLACFELGNCIGPRTIRNRCYSPRLRRSCIGAENGDGGYVVNLEVDGGFLALTIPADYQYQPVELTEIERYPFTYTLLMRKQKLRFGAKLFTYSKRSNHLLKKLYDRSNKFIVVSDGF